MWDTSHVWSTARAGQSLPTERALLHQCSSSIAVDPWLPSMERLWPWSCLNVLLGSSVLIKTTHTHSLWRTNLEANANRTLYIFTVICHPNPFHVPSVVWGCWAWQSKVTGGKDSLSEFKALLWLPELYVHHQLWFSYGCCWEQASRAWLLCSYWQQREQPGACVRSESLFSEKVAAELIQRLTL